MNRSRTASDDRQSVRSLSTTSYSYSVSTSSSTQFNLISTAYLKDRFSTRKKAFDTVFIASFIVYGIIDFAIGYKNILDTYGNTWDFLKFPPELAILALGSKVLADILSNNLYYYFSGEFCIDFRERKQQSKKKCASDIFWYFIYILLGLSCFLAVINYVNYRTKLSFISIFPFAALVYKGKGRYKPIYTYNFTNADLPYFKFKTYLYKIAFLENYFHGLSRINSEIDSDIDKTYLTNALNALMTFPVEKIDTTIEPFLNKILSKISKTDTKVSNLNIIDNNIDIHDYQVKYLWGGTNYYLFRSEDSINSHYYPDKWRYAIGIMLIIAIYTIKSSATGLNTAIYLTNNSISGTTISTIVSFASLGCFLPYLFSIFLETFYIYELLRSSRAAKLNSKQLCVPAAAVLIATFSIAPILFNNPTFINNILPIYITMVCDIATSFVLNFVFLRALLSFLFAKRIETPLIKAADAAAEFFTSLEIAMSSIYTDDSEKTSLLQALGHIMRQERLASSDLNLIAQSEPTYEESQPFRAATVSHYTSHNVINAYRQFQEANSAHLNETQRAL